MSTTFFVAGDWLADHIDDPHIQILDARMAQPTQHDRDIKAEYLAGHIPGARLFDIEALSDGTSPLPHMMPRPESFAVAMRELGIASQKHLVIYDDGNLFSAPRAWWMLKCVGVENVSILAGGMADWLREDLALESGEPQPLEGDFEVKFTPGAIRRLPEVLVASHEGSVQLVDARPAARFNAEADEPRPGLRRGHIPGARNVPWTELVENGQLKTTDDLTFIFSSHGVRLNQPIIVSCGSGVTAAVLALALATIGIDDVALYDGSWSEWGARDDLPIEPRP
ncbi:3-mercaptopyruvate sulfurtransferase [Shimwellia pseudoproteus]|uniref:3-mercaptopyruvate sulfurtransferase n=1 Tax=Shimwellia pseudoproteus TaxID=570012 RepID=UPI0018EBD8D5|nr:3-mercaptopyruvate sulfurtransferase [Shimwellia pseudoproteus]MBJ3815673.1 3-mercaptopyruvate sulfurtransferase [Shimwellia pseudoproteus]